MGCISALFMGSGYQNGSHRLRMPIGEENPGIWVIDSGLGTWDPGLGTRD